MFVVPYILVHNWPTLQNKQGPLTGTQVQRGAFMNTGSKDAGPDPDWKNGTYVGKR